MKIKCACVNTDGSRCGRAVTDGSNPPICHLHRAVAAGNPHNGGTVTPFPSKPKPVVDLSTFDPLTTLAEIAAGTPAKHDKQVQALRELIDEQRNKPKKDTSISWVFLYATDEQIAALAQTRVEQKKIFAEIQAYRDGGGKMREEYLPDGTLDPDYVPPKYRHLPNAVPGLLVPLKPVAEQIVETDEVQSESEPELEIEFYDYKEKNK